jgi:hypothetical protein
VADSFNNIWVDASFLAGDTDEEDISVEYVIASPDNIGSRSIPTVYFNPNFATRGRDVSVGYTTSASLPGTRNLNVLFFSQGTSALSTSLVDFGAEYFAEKTLTSGTNDFDVQYVTGYNTVSGSVNKRVSAIIGNLTTNYIDRYNYFRYYPSISGVLNNEMVYQNFTGSIIDPYLSISYDNEVEYGFGTTSTGTTDKIVDISFAGWANFPHMFDVYSCIEDLSIISTIDVENIDGGIPIVDMDVYATTVSATILNLDTYSSDESNYYTFFDLDTISGSVDCMPSDVYSTVSGTYSCSIDIDLYPIKIGNFSLDIEAYTDATNSIYVDVTDDTCPVSVSGTYLMVDGQTVVTTMSGIIDGYRMFYDPINDYVDLEGPTIFTVHAENECGDSLEESIYLTFGYIVEFNNSDNLYGIDYGFGNKVVVRVSVEDFASCPSTDTLAFEFESKNRYNTDLSASITGIEVVGDTGYDNLSASISPISTAYFYGKEFVVVVNAKDFAGNEMEPLVLTYRIEDKS